MITHYVKTKPSFPLDTEHENTTLYAQQRTIFYRNKPHALTCETKRTRTHLGDRSFSVAGPCIWNCLPAVRYVTEISHLYSLRDFWRHFGSCRAAAHSDCCFFVAVYKYSYLLTY